MAKHNLKISFALALILAISGAASLAQSGQPVRNNVESLTAPPAPAPAVEATPDSPPNPPNVVCNGNQLTITTNNSLLGSVLADVHGCIGVKIDLPDGAATSRVFDKLGPGPAREVLAALLSSTGFDFVIGSSKSDPEKIESVLLMARAGDKAAGALPESDLTPGRRKGMLMLRDIRTGEPPAEQSLPAANPELDTTAKADSAATPAESPAAPPVESPAAANPDQTPASDQAPAPGDSNPVPRVTPSTTQQSANPPPSSSSDTQDQITSMEKLFQQRRQMNQTQPSQSPQ